MALTSLHARQQQIAGPFEENKGEMPVRRLPQPVPIASLQRRTGNHQPLRCSLRGLYFLADPVEPGQAVVVSKRYALRHLLDISSGVELVALQKRHVVSSGEMLSNRGFAAAADAHDDDSKRPCLFLEVHDLVSIRGRS
jgi:hypothetical protein